MIHYLHTQDDLAAGLVQLIALDSRLKAVAEKAGAFNLRRREGGFPGLCAIVCGQQLSTASAAAIRDRLFAAFDPFHHDSVRKARPERLRKLGLSDAKIKSIKAIGGAIAKAEIDLDALAHMEADAAHAALVSLHGVGLWTADIYLLFCLGHADAFPAGDLAVQEAARIAFNLRHRPDAKQLTKLAEVWRPWRGVAAHLLWAYYHAVKRREGAALAPATKRNWPQIKKTRKKKTGKTISAKRNGAKRART